LFSVLDDDQRNVEYVRENLDVIKARFQNLNKEVSGQTVEIYVNRVRLSLDDSAKWSTDRAQWERDSAAKGGARCKRRKESAAEAKDSGAQRRGGSCFR
jgi:hypothetical protein